MRSSALLILVACGGGGANVTGDASTDSAIDADNDAAIDAPTDAPTDAPPDAFVDPATRVEVVAYTSDGTGVPDTSGIAIFNDPSGATIKHGPVDANGLAFAYMPAGGSVIVLYAKSNPMNLAERFVRISIVRGVEPGDRLKTGFPFKTQITRTGITTVMQAAYTDPVQQSVSMLAACGQDGGVNNPRNITFYPSCVTSTFDLLAASHDAAGRYYVFMNDVPYAAGTTFTVPNTWQLAPRSTVTWHNVPDNLSRVFVASHGYVEGRSFEVDRGVVELPAPGTHSVSVMYAPTESSTKFVSNLIQGIKSLGTYTVVTNSPASITVDWNTLVLPQATLVQQSATGLTWTQNSAGAPDARVMSWHSQWSDGNNITRYASYEIIDDPSAPTGFVLPTLPSAYAADDPSLPTNSTLRGGTVFFVDFDNLADFDAARPYGASLSNIEDTFPNVAHRARETFGSKFATP